MPASDIRGRARRSDDPLGVWANCTLVSKNILLASTPAPRRPRKTFCGLHLLAPPHPTLLRCSEGRGSPRTSRKVWCCFYHMFSFKSPSDRHRTNCLWQSRVPGVCSAEPSSAPLTHTGAWQRLAEVTILPVFPVLDLVLAKKMAAWISSWKQIRTIEIL